MYFSQKAFNKVKRSKRNSARPMRWMVAISRYHKSFVCLALVSYIVATIKSRFPGLIHNESIRLTRVSKPWLQALWAESWTSLPVYFEAIRRAPGSLPQSFLPFPQPTLTPITLKLNQISTPIFRWPKETSLLTWSLSKWLLPSSWPLPQLRSLLSLTPVGA